MTELTDFLKAKASPTLHMVKTLKAIEEKVLVTSKQHVETEVGKVVDEMKETGLAMIVDIAEEKMVELKASLSERLSAEIMADVTAVFEKGSTIERFRGIPGVSPKVEDIANALLGSEAFIRKTKGTDAIPLIKGVDYDDGEDGESPEPEEIADVLKNDPSFVEKTKGKDGSQDTVKQIAKKLNSETEIVNMSSIKGLKEAFMGIKSRLRKKGGGGSGGGGMGDPIKFSFTGDGSTTEFTLPAVPSGGGLALWAYSDSAWLQPGIHFDVSQLKFTATTAPEDGAIIEGFLIP